MGMGPARNKIQRSHAYFDIMKESDWRRFGGIYD